MLNEVVVHEVEGVVQVSEVVTGSEVGWLVTVTVVDSLERVVSQTGYQPS